MKSLTKTELKWMYSAMENKVNMLLKYVAEAKEPTSTALAEHEIESLAMTMEKIENILANGTKRIEIK